MTLSFCDPWDGTDVIEYCYIAIFIHLSRVVSHFLRFVLYVPDISLSMLVISLAAFQHFSLVYGAKER